MAKAKQAKPEETPEANNDNVETTPKGKSPGVERANRIAKDRFIRNFDEHGKAVAPAKKLPPQAQVICNVLEAAKTAGFTREELCTALKGVLVTKQPEGRILAYYQKLLTQESGCVTLKQAAEAV